MLYLLQMGIKPTLRQLMKLTKIHTAVSDSGTENFSLAAAAGSLVEIA